MNEELAKLIGWAAVIIIPLLIIGALLTKGFTSLANLIRYGQFTSDSRTAVVESHANDPHYFSELAKKAQISLVSAKLRTIDGLLGSGNQGVRAKYVLKNESNQPHLIQISVATVRIIVNGHLRTKHLNCDLGPGNSFTIPADSSIKTGQCFDNTFARIGGQATFISKPQIIGIDNLPVTGGPQNTPWKCITSQGPNGFKFTNNCTM